jgi:hypothetical protein
MLRNLEHQTVIEILNLQSVKDRRQISALEMYIYDGTNYLGNFSYGLLLLGFGCKERPTGLTTDQTSGCPQRSQHLDTR